MIWGILVGLAYLGVAVLAFREFIALYIREFGRKSLSTGDVWFFSGLCLLWPTSAFSMWVVYGGPTWYKPRTKTKRDWTGLENWATKKKED